MFIFVKATILSSLAFLSVAYATPNGRPDINTRKGFFEDAKAIYFLSNEIENSVVALKVNRDGTLSPGSVHLTGGKGAAGIDDATNATATRDVLFSQSALKADGNLLAAVNAGSNTVSLFAISSHDATCLRLIGSPVSTMGDFPVTVALSARKSLACVANSGVHAGIACFHASAEMGLTPLSPSLLASFDLKQSNPPRGPLNTVSHAFFNADASALVTTVKGNPVKNKTSTGFISVIPIHGSYPQPLQEARLSPPGTAALFGSVVIPNITNSTTPTNSTNSIIINKSNTFLSTDASFGATTLSLSLPISLPHSPPSSHSSSNSDSSRPPISITSLSRTPIPSQRATCWATFSPFRSTVFVTDVARNILVEIDPRTGSLVQQTTLPNGKNPGFIDLVAGGRLVYVLSPAAGEEIETAVVVVDVSGQEAKVVQRFEVAGLGVKVGGRAMGMTIAV